MDFQTFGYKHFKSDICVMYIKAVRKYCQAEKATHTYFRLSESYRDKCGFPRQRMILGLGRLPELSNFDQKVFFLERLNELIKGKPTLFNSSKDETVEQLAQHYYEELKKKKKIDIVSDVTEDFDTVNLNTLKNKNIREVGAESLCYQALHQSKDKKKQPIELLNVRVENDTDNYLWVKSEAKALKENSMYNQFAQRFEEGICGIQNGISSKGGTKKTDKVWERIGRLKEKYASVHQYYEITVRDNGKGIATGLVFEKKAEATMEGKAGIYFLRTSLNGKEEQTLWLIYNVLREIEYTFRILKTDLDLRPIYHKTDDASMAHLQLGLLAYWIVSTIRYQLKLHQINHSWSEIVRMMNTQKNVTTTVENIKGETIQIRQCSEPSVQVKEIYSKLKYHTIPMARKKSVWHTDEILKNVKSDNQLVMDG